MQKHTIKLLLKKNKTNKQKQHPIYIRITVERKSSFLSTGYHIHKTYWDERNECVKPTHPLYEQINLDIANRKKEALQNMVHASVKGITVSAQDIKEQTAMGEERTCIFSFSERFIEEMDSKREAGTKSNWEKHLRKLEAYHGSRKLDFEAITADYLNKFESWLRKGGVETRAGKNPDNYIHAIMKSIRKMFNAAKDKGLITCYPFHNYEMPEPTPDNKDRLTLAELDKLEQYARETFKERHREVAVWFLFGCYTGLRVSDWYNFNLEADVHDGYISIEAIKNKERVSIPIHARLKRVLQMMKEAPLRTYEQDINENLKYICSNLKIKKKLTSHSGRKTFAVTMCAERGISSETCAKLMGITIKVCVESYYQVTPHKVKHETEKAWSNI